ncbi:hypothetical protein ACSAZK_00005 [Methanosarcina sp. Mfa9]|uniref:hypothetical protein n=1 Tax=Methanosarcina sp. Mfa9 TaxID=3439063 RepID=UPI003F872FB3
MAAEAGSVPLHRPCLIELGVRVDKTLEKLGTPLQKFPMDDAAPSLYAGSAGLKKIRYFRAYAPFSGVVLQIVN